MTYLRNVVVFFALVAFGTCSRPDTAQDELAQNIKASVPATEVNSVKASVRPFDYFVSASGKIVSASEVRMQFGRAGIVEKILVTNGQVVARGQLLAVLTHETQELTFSKAKLLMKEKNLAFEDQMMSYITDSLRHKKASENIKISSGLAAAELAYQESKFEYENSFVRAQISGLISGLELNAGSPVNQSDLLCYVHDPENLLVRVDVLESDALLLSKGTPAEIQPIAAAARAYPARIETINPRVDEKTGLVKVVLRITGKSNAFPGMHVRSTMRLPYNKNIIIPKEAVVIRSGKAVVFTVSNSLAKWNYVTLGHENGMEVEILEGLKEGDDVIVTNNLQLAHDAPVTVR